MPEAIVRIHYETKSGRQVTGDTFLSHITSALYGRMGEWGWTTVEVFKEPEHQAALEALKADNKLHEDFLVEVSELLPPSYDADEAVESIILTFVKDMSEVGRVVAKLTADYR